MITQKWIVLACKKGKRKPTGEIPVDDAVRVTVWDVKTEAEAIKGAKKLVKRPDYLLQEATEWDTDMSTENTLAKKQALFLDKAIKVLK
jgi:hypothetical protein